MSEDRVRLEIDDGVAVARMVRADKHNALDMAMFRALAQTPERLAGEPGVRAVVLCGEGPSFCSGLDIASVMAELGDSNALLEPDDERGANLAQRAVVNWPALPVPVIAAVHGACFGGGMQLALGADLRVAAPDARMSVMEMKWGLIPDMGITRSLPRLVGIDVAKELTFTARIVSGEEAGELGLVTRVAADPFAAAVELARGIASRSPDAIRAAKRLYDESWTAPMKQSLELETELQRALIGSPNQLAAVAAGMSEQPAEFADPE